MAALNFGRMSLVDLISNLLHVYDAVAEPAQTASTVPHRRARPGVGSGSTRSGTPATRSTGGGGGLAPMLTSRAFFSADFRLDSESIKSCAALTSKIDLPSSV